MSTIVEATLISPVVVVVVDINVVGIVDGAIDGFVVVVTAAVAVAVERVVAGVEDAEAEEEVVSKRVLFLCRSKSSGARNTDESIS